MKKKLVTINVKAHRKSRSNMATVFFKNFKSNFFDLYESEVRICKH